MLAVFRKDLRIFMRDRWALLFAIALGLVIFGLYSWCEARWRVVEPG